MLTGPTTRASLLASLGDGSASAWAEFVSQYEPFLLRYALSKGLQHSDAEDVCQSVMLAIVRHFTAGKFAYDPVRGCFRAYLKTALKHQIIDFYRRQGRRAVPLGGTTALELQGQIPAPPDDGELDREYEQWLLERVLAKLESRKFSPDSIAIFRLSAFGGLTSAEVARELGINVKTVYLAKNRVLNAVRAELQGGSV